MYITSIHDKLLSATYILYIGFSFKVPQTESQRYNYVANTNLNNNVIVLSLNSEQAVSKINKCPMQSCSSYTYGC